MNLTFKGFLKAYCAEVTGVEATSLKRLCAACSSKAPAAAEAVMVFAAMQGKTEYLLKLAANTWMEEMYSAAAQEIKKCDNVEEWLCTESAPQRFRKVWLAYTAKKNAASSDRRVILLMREKTLTAMEAASITTYRLCKNLGLNLGNVYAYLGKGDSTKVSRATARRIMDYTVQLAAD